jgi:hypothetical protein
MKLKIVLISGIVMAVLLAGASTYFIGKEIAKKYLYLGFSQAADSFTKCLPEDDSAEAFPEYFQACVGLCNSLYDNEPICVSHISGGSVTCVCEQN